MAGITPLARQCFNPTKAMYHYQRIYVKHDERYLHKQGYPMKRFMYYLRGILACQWIEKYKTLPPVSFQKIYEEIVEGQKIKDGIKELADAKSSGKEKDMSEVPKYLVDYYLPIAEYYSDLVGKFRPNIENEGVSERLNRFFYETVTGDKYDCWLNILYLHRNMKKNFLSQKPDPLKEDWEGLILRLKTLMTNALVLSKMDLFHAIGRQIIVLEQN